MCATSDQKKTNFRILKNMLCKVGISNSLWSRTVYVTIFKVIFAYNRQSNWVQTIGRKFTRIHDISKQIEQRARIGKIFARWHLAIAITIVYLNTKSITWPLAEITNFSSRVQNISLVCSAYAVKFFSTLTKRNSVSPRGCHTPSICTSWNFRYFFHLSCLPLGRIFPSKMKLHFLLCEM